MSSIYVYETNTESLNHLKPRNPLVKSRVKSLQNDLLLRYGLDFKRSGSYRKGFIRLRQRKAKEPSGLLFYFCKSTHGIYLQEIVLPSYRRTQGIGTFCVNWLKDFAEEFGFRYIVLGSRPEAQGFWQKMGFSPVPYDEAQEKYPWISAVPTSFKK